VCPQIYVIDIVAQSKKQATSIGEVALKSCRFLNSLAGTKLGPGDWQMRRQSQLTWT
jgi:hypothetical protein